MLSFIALIAIGLVASSVAKSAEVDDILGALNKRLASSAAKVEALRASTEKVLSKRHTEAKRHASVLGRKRQAAACPDGSSLDTDRDGHLDCFDQCPNDFRKTRPGVCGCGESDVDSDNDGLADCLDACPLDAEKREPGLCGCGAADTGCGCNVEPVRLGDCSHVVGVQSVSETVGATFDVFGPHGGIGARLVLPEGALALGADEQLVLKLTEAQIDANSDNQVHSLALDIDLVTPRGVEARDRATNGYLLDRAATVCLQPESELQAEGLCLGFFDAKTNGFKCFETSLDFDPSLKLACARVSLLTRVQLVRRARHTSLNPYIKSVSPNACPADGSCALQIAGGNFDRGVLTRVSVGGVELDVELCRYNSRVIQCERIPAGRGADLAIEVEFTNHVAADMRFAASLENAMNYESARIHEVSLVGDRIQVRGHNFGPVGKLHESAVLVDGEPCTQASVDEHDSLLTCLAPARTLAKRKVYDMHMDDDDDHDKHEHDTYDAEGNIKRRRHHEDDDEEEHHEPLIVAVQMHHDAGYVQSTGAHFTRSCMKAGESMCGDRSCVSRFQFCPHCPSGWARCPLMTPVMSGGHCHTVRWQQEHKVDEFDVTLDGTHTRLLVGDNAALDIAYGSGPSHEKHCISVSMPAYEQGDFASHVYNITSMATWTGMIRLEIHSDAIMEAGGDPYGFCLARYNNHNNMWECVDESLEMGPAPQNFASGDAMLHKGTNWFALMQDNCPHVENPSQEDENGNGIGDACDAPAEVAESCRDRSEGNVKYIQKILASTSFDVEEQDCPAGEPDGSRPVCNVNGKIFNKHVAAWSGPARPLPLETPYPASEKGGRKPFPNRQGIHAYPVAARQEAVRQKPSP